MSSISLVNPSIRCMNGGYTEDKYENQSRNNGKDKDVYETHWLEVLWRSPPQTHHLRSSLELTPQLRDISSGSNPLWVNRPRQTEVIAQTPVVRSAHQTQRQTHFEVLQMAIKNVAHRRCRQLVQDGYGSITGP